MTTSNDVSESLQEINNASSLHNEECIELKNIKYKTMLLSGNIIQEIKSSNDLTNLDKFLEDNKTKNQSEPWSKLDKTIKTKKLISFADNYCKEKSYTFEESTLLIAFLKDSLDRKRLQRIKDVDYDKSTGEIKDIPALHFNKVTKHFTLKNLDKRISTVKSLPPKKARGTAKNVKETASSGSSSDSEKE
jgi:hypothetical protein